MLKSILKQRSGAAKAASDARTAIDEIRALRLRLLDERDAVAARPIPRSMAEAAIGDGLARVAREHLDTLNFAALLRPADGRSPRLPSLSTDQLLALLLVANGDAVAAMLRDRLAETYGDDPGLEPGERDAECAALDRQIADVEMAEEAAIRDAEDAGLAILRRGDADPRATLASDASLGR